MRCTNALPGQSTPPINTGSSPRNATGSSLPPPTFSSLPPPTHPSHHLPTPPRTSQVDFLEALVRVAVVLPMPSLLQMHKAGVSNPYDFFDQQDLKVWCWCGAGVVLVWCWCGTGTVLVCSILVLVYNNRSRSNIISLHPPLPPPPPPPPPPPQKGGQSPPQDLNQSGYAACDPKFASTNPLYDRVAVMCTYFDAGLKR
jgi:hypothetical protein